MMLRILTSITFLLAVINARRQTYLASPVLTAQNKTHMTININIDINQHPYRISFSLNNNPNYIIPLDQQPKASQKTSNYDYRKRPESVYGIVNYYAHEKIDERLSLFRQLYLNFYHFITNIPEKQQWVDFKHFEQIQRPADELSEGNIDLSIRNKNPFIQSLIKFNTYYRHNLVTFDLGKKQSWIYFGSFPVNRLKHASQYARIKTVNMKWNLNVESLSLLPNGNSNNLSLSSINALYKLSLTQKALKLPKNAVDSLVNVLRGCKVQKKGEQHLVDCNEQSFMQYQNFKLSFKIPGSSVTLQYKLSNLVRKIDNNIVQLNIKVSLDDQLSLSVLMLKHYLVGFDLEKSQLLFGYKRGDIWLSQGRVFKLLLIINIFIFIISVFVLTITSQFTPVQNKKEVEREVPKFSNSKASGYQMAEMSQQSERQIEGNPSSP